MKQNPNNACNAMITARYQVLFACFSIIFRLAARIISSLRFCSKVCRSVLLFDHANFVSCDCSAVTSPLPSRLYLCIRFGPDGDLTVGCEGLDDGGGVGGGGRFGWKLGGGCESLLAVFNNSREHRFSLDPTRSAELINLQSLDHDR
jgi:hypothetical protein